VGLLCGLALTACYRIPRTTFPDADFSDDGGEAGSGTGGSGGTAGHGGSGTAATAGSAGNASGGTNAVGGSAGSGLGATAGGAGGGVGGRGGTNEGGTGGGGAGGMAPGCSPTCTPTQICVGTKCLSNDGESCTIASQCASNVCTPFYVDADGDGYGAGAPTGFCGTSTPIGHATQAGDCCDDSSFSVAKLIHPGADYQTSSANGACGITWDYDCSGTVETSKSNGLCASASYPPNNCITTPRNYSATVCGMNEATSTCINYQNSCQSVPGSDNGPLGCK